MNSLRVLRWLRELRVSEELLEDSAQAPGDAAERPGAAARRLGHAIAVRIEDHANRRRKDRTVHVIGKAADAERAAAADRQIEDLLGDLGHPFEDGAATSEDDARVQRLLEAGAPDFVPHEMECLLRAGLEDLRQDLPRHDARLATADAGHFDGLVLVHHRRERAAVLALDLLGVWNGRSQPDGDV